MARSFKKPQDCDFQFLSQYRTPSPPPQWAKEPLTPTYNDSSRALDGVDVFGGARSGADKEQEQRSLWSGRNGQFAGKNLQLGPRASRETRVNVKRVSPPATSAMDAFASIALATSPTFDAASEHDTALKSPASFGHYHVSDPPSIPTAYGEANGQYGPEERPWKRARSEVPFPRDVLQFESRPATSYTTYGASSQSTDWHGTTNVTLDRQVHRTPKVIPDSSTDDAELLLNVSRAAFLSSESRPLGGQPANDQGRRNLGRSTIPPSASHQPATMCEEKLSRNSSSPDWMHSAYTSNTSVPRAIDSGSSKGSSREPIDGSKSAKEKGTLTDRVQPMKAVIDHTTGDSVSETTSYQATHNSASVALSDAHFRKGSKKKQTRANVGWPKGKPRGPRNNRPVGRKPQEFLHPHRMSRGTQRKLPDANEIRNTAQSFPRRRNSMSSLLHNGHLLATDIAESSNPVSSLRPGLRRTLSDSAFFSHGRSRESANTLGNLDLAHGKVLPPFNGEVILIPEAGTGIHGPQQIATCAGCKMLPNSLGGRDYGEEVSWINCDACKRWFHFACAGFATEKEVRSVDKYICMRCKETHGPTTYVRKSSRAHTAIDYAGLNEGVVKTSNDTPDHPYIAPLKERTINFFPENFARLRPELVTLDFFEKGNGMKEPLVVPAWMNPQQRTIFAGDSTGSPSAQEYPESSDPILGRHSSSGHFADNCDYNDVRDDGQDALDMVIPRGLTVRRVADLYGPDEKVDVIDVKSQGEDGRWKMKKWADYYESADKKFIRNVISLEISYSDLGRLVKRPRIVRDMDLVESVWPVEAKARGDFPKVQLYCLMSVADSFTDFHIDFGGSSVFYHILKGKKTFLFIPPKKKHLKKYEQWCLSPAQNQTFLPDQTNECYRVDLSEGDTMLIPSGWIHAVWTPEDSLVIGGNFLTRMHYAMQIQVAEIEKNTKVPRKFRHPHFQRVLWYTAIRYLKDDPTPEVVINLLHEGKDFRRETPPYYEFDQWGPKSKPGPENYQARYYSQHELDGLPHLLRYLFRTALIAVGKIADGITNDTRQRVGRAIPKGHGEPTELIKKFALWSAWKRGNELIPSWAHPDAVPGGDLPSGGAEKKPTAAAIRRMEREAAIEAHRVAPERQSERKQAQALAAAAAARAKASLTIAQKTDVESPPSHEQPNLGVNPSQKRKSGAAGLDGGIGAQSHAPNSTPKRSVLGPKRIACDDCRKRRIGCKHKRNIETPATPLIASADEVVLLNHLDPSENRLQDGTLDSASLLTGDATKAAHEQHLGDPVSGESRQPVRESASTAANLAFAVTPRDRHGDFNSNTSLSAIAASNSKKGRNRACDDCRRSKRRCVHDENGNVDPVKVQEASEKRLAGTSKRRHSGEDEVVDHVVKKQKPQDDYHSIQVDGAQQIAVVDHGMGEDQDDPLLVSNLGATHGREIPEAEQSTYVQLEVEEKAQDIESTLSGTRFLNGISAGINGQHRPLRGEEIKPSAVSSDVIPVAEVEMMQPVKSEDSGKASSISANLSPPDEENRSINDNLKTRLSSQDAPHLESNIQSETTPPQQKLPSPPSSPLSEREISPTPDFESPISQKSVDNTPFSRRSSSRTCKPVQHFATESWSGSSVKPRSASAKSSVATASILKRNGASPEAEDHRLSNFNGKPESSVKAVSTNGMTPSPTAKSRKAPADRSSSVLSSTERVDLPSSSDVAVVIETKPHHSSKARAYSSTASPSVEEDESWKVAKLTEFSLRRRGAAH
ncbi:MAG: JmjC domain-containing histone demethylation protein 1 [Sclerophora amabilis]|nr:MAG: JmjC domain-containing histone demethylation protein 1 [Sclerophora amabilis]